MAARRNGYFGYPKRDARLGGAVPELHGPDRWRSAKRQESGHAACRRRYFSLCRLRHAGADGYVAVRGKGARLYDKPFCRPQSEDAEEHDEDSHGDGPFCRSRRDFFPRLQRLPGPVEHQRTGTSTWPRRRTRRNTRTSSSGSVGSAPILWSLTRFSRTRLSRGPNKR